MYKNKFALPMCLIFVSTAYAQDDESPNKTEPLEITIPYCGNNHCNTSSASRIPLGNYKQSRTVRVVDKAATNDTSSQRIEDVIGNIAGVTPGITQSGFNTSINIRGFSTGGQVFINGHRDNERFFTRDFVTIERTEVLKGHSGVLYGSGNPGGVLNYISKKPQPVAANTASVSLGNRSLARITADSTGALNDDKSLRYRLSVAAQDADHFYDNASNDRWIVAPSLLWRYGANNSVGVEAELAHDNTPLVYGTVISNGEILFDQSYIDPRAKSDRDYTHARLYWDHALSSNWGFHTTAAAYQTKRDDRHIGFFFKLDEETLRGFYREVDDDYSQYLTRAELRGTELGTTFNHNVIFGIEKNKDRDSVKALRILDFTLDARDPQFDTDFSLLEGEFRDFRITNNETGVYAIDRMDVTDQFNFQIGVRYSSYDTDFIEEQAATLTNQHTISKSIGFNYHPSKNLAFYGSASESFTPNAGQDRENNFFDPKEAIQYEIGLRKNLPAYGFAFNASIFQITQDNLLTTDPLDRYFRVLAGEQKHRGMEISGNYSLTNSINLSMGYAYLDAEITKNNDGLEGNIPTNAPKHSGYLQLDYTPPTLSGLKLSAGVIGVSERQADRENSLTVPGYGRVDLGLSYRRNDWKASLSAYNVFNKDYIATSNAQDDIYQGQPRTVIASILFDFR